MNDPQITFAQQWLEKADHDIITARQTLALEDGPTDTPCFHAQQPFEKSLKALLTAHAIFFPRTHDLITLLDLSVDLLTALEAFREICAELSAYGVEVRYPGDIVDPSREDAYSTLSAAEQIIELVQNRINAS